MKRGEKFIALTARILLIALFLYASWYKLKDYSLFVSQLKAVPTTAPYLFLSWLIPSLELATVVLLIFNRTVLLGFWSSFILMFAFTGYVYYLPHFAKVTGCSCGGIISHFTWQQHFYFNLFFLALSIIPAAYLPNRNSTPHLDNIVATNG